MRISDWSSDVCSPDLCSLIISVMQSRKDFCIPRRASCCSRWRLHSSSPLMRCLDGYSSCERLDCEWYAAGRSEEHTSELQSLMRISYAVFCLKKKHRNCDHHICSNTARYLSHLTIYTV